MSDSHKDVDVEDHVKTMMNNTGRSKRNSSRLDEVERKQDEVREVLIPAIREEVRLARQEYQALKNLPTIVQDNGKAITNVQAYQIATRWLIVAVVMITGLAMSLITILRG